MKKEILNDMPEVTLYEGAFSGFFCDFVCWKYDKYFKQSKVVNVYTSESELDPSWRTSSSFFMYRNDFISHYMHRKFSKIIGRPTKTMQRVTLTKYEEGQEYKNHYDFYDQSVIEKNPNIKKEGQRIATAIVYLRTPDEGGATSFSKLKFAVLPSKGDMLVFKYNYPFQVVNDMTIHAGEKVIKGTKIIATLWACENDTTEFVV